jgi:SAM-dependent methyltransferase
MLADEPRLGAFREAILKLVPTGSHVVELGGGTGVLSFYAGKNARKVVCVERLSNTADVARRLLHDNGAHNVEVVEADALNWLPKEPVDVLICEMLHSGLLREKQVQVLSAFKARHRARFGKDVPRIIPEASILAVQPIHQPYDFGGYRAPVPLFFTAGAASNTVELGRPIVYAALDYVRDYSAHLSCDQILTIEEPGTLNALRFVTKNVVGIFPNERRSADWHMHYLSLPLAQPLAVHRGDRVRVCFAYDAGCSIEALLESLSVSAE